MPGVTGQQCTISNPAFCEDLAIWTVKLRGTEALLGHTRSIVRQQYQWIGGVACYQLTSHDITHCITLPRVSPTQQITYSADVKNIVRLVEATSKRLYASIAYFPVSDAPC